MNKNIVINTYKTVISLNLFIVDGKKIRNTMTTMREAGLSRPEAGLDPRLTANGAPKAPKEEEECHVSQKLAVLQEESLKPIKEDLAEWIARTLGNQGGVNVRLSLNSVSQASISLIIISNLDVSNIMDMYNAGLM